jgi:hypothetical protein
LGDRIAFTYMLEHPDGSPAEAPTFRSSTLNWRQGDKIYLPGERTLRVLGVRDDDADQPPALVVEDLPGSATSASG